MTKPKDKSLIKFPCDFVIKVMGKHNSQFEDKVLAIVRQFFPDFGNGHLKRHLSKNKNYLSLTITVHAESKQRLDELYQALSDAPEVLMAL